ncbi:hypothetical protein [Streptomyces naganishii]|uniref:Lipoprotein n=1 Tax=Streptomyces naganishii JCM 4654 TaxID=1306179 RepID=A0A918YBJ6_9ACTN|nr:hypothetical protein [Streptomyces naganishii]GHD96855.1 lipoprotein [Streptomyces naganishii JCM 4654]
MPYPPFTRALAGPRRRSLLASAAGAALLAGCSAGSEDSGGTGGGPSPADRVRAAAAGDSQALARRYDAVAAAHPDLAERLRPLRAQVAAHAKAFGGTTAPAGTASPDAEPSRARAGSEASPAGSPPGSGPGSAPGSPGSGLGTPAGAGAGVANGGSSTGAVPRKAKDALAELAAAERALADRRAAVLEQVPGELARLLASVAAAGAAHAYLLTEGGR